MRIINDIQFRVPTEQEAQLAFQHLKQQYSQLRPLFDKIGVLKLPIPVITNIEEAVVSITIGQMLSRKAAQSIYQRVIKCQNELGLASILSLDDAVFLSCGLSNGKVKTLRSFQRYQQEQPHIIEQWSSMDYPQLVECIKGKIWGFADWSISILGQFYFMNADVFPVKDGSLQKALNLLQYEYNHGKEINYTKASPYCSYFALACWKWLDEGWIGGGGA